MKKTNKLISILLVLAMLLSMAPIAVFTASAALTPTATGGCDGNHSGYTALSQSGWSLKITQPGNYYINKDWAMETYEPTLVIECSGTVTVCLNGYDLYHTGNSSRVVYIYATGGDLTVNLCDCKGTGEIYHNNTETGIDLFGVRSNGYYATINMYGGTIRDCSEGISESANTRFNMYGGTIKGCSYYGVFQSSSDGKVNIYGGSIINNNEGIRVCSADAVTLTGSPVITGNTNGDLYFRQNNSPIIAKNLSVNEKITIAQYTAKDCAVVKVDSEEAYDYFEALDPTARTISHNDNTIWFHGDHLWKDANCTEPKTCQSCGMTEGEALGHDWKEATCTAPETCSVCGGTQGEVAPHAYNTYTIISEAKCGLNAKETASCDYGCGTTDTREIEGTALTHSFTYSASGNTITAECANGVDCPNPQSTLTISAPADLYVDGTTAKEATVENNLADTSVAVDVTYSTADGSAPTVAGTYTASVTVGGATASVEFELVKRSAIAENFVYTSPENLVYDGTPKYATVEASPEITGMGEITVAYYKDGEAVEPINAGTYTVKVSTADSDKYYAINDIELASFTIQTKDISDGFIILGDPLTYNGTEQTQTVEKVVATGTAPEVTYTVSGNKATNVGVYLLTVTGTGNFSGEAMIAYEIAVDASGIEGLTPLNVKSSDKAKIEYVYNQLENAVTDLADADKRAEWDNLKSDCVELLKMIESVADKLEGFKNKLAGYDIDTVTSDDADDLESFYNEVAQVYNDYFDNLTEAETKEFDNILSGISALQKRISDVAKEITRITDAVNGYDKATVKSSDKADLEQLIADINALTTGNNITDSERADLLALADTVNELLAVISDTADEISRIINAVNAYDINTVTGDDVQDLLGLIDDANALLETDNLTSEETDALNQAVKDVQSLISRYDRTSAQLGDIKERMNRYDEATVKSSDKADIEQLIADIKDLTDGQNITAEEREYLVNADAECDKLLAKIAETTAEYDRVIAAANGYDEATITSADKEALVQLNADIYALALIDNVTAEEKENLQAAHDKVLGLIDKLTGISDEIKRIIEKVDAYVFESVKSTDKADIEQLIADIKALLDTQNITADERTLLEGADETCDKLIAKIDETVAEINRINDATNAYDIDTVTSADKEAIEKLLADIKALTDGDNITDAEREQLEDNEATLNALLDKIGATADEIERIEKAVNSYDEATVKSTDKADLEKLIEDIKDLTDATNITEDERTKLGELDATLDSLIKKIDDTALEIERIDEAVNSYDKETVTSADVPALGKLIDDIKALIDGDNLTEDEKATLEETDKAIGELVEKLTEVAEEIKRVDEAVKSYDEETVKSSDKADLEQLKEDIQALIDSTNTTENEKTALGEMIEKINALLDKISETEEKLEEIKGIENNYNPENITSDDKAAIEDAIAEIEAVNSDNLTDEQKAEYAEIKAELETLLEEIAAAEKAVEDIGIELEMFDENRVTIFWEDEIEALKAKIDELLADENMGEAEKAKLNEYKAQAEKLIEIINDPCEYFSMRLFYFVWDALNWLVNHVVFIFNWIVAMF